MNESELVQKIKYILVQISKQNEEHELVEVLNHSKFQFKNHWNQRSFSNLFNLDIKLTPEIFVKYNGRIDEFAKQLNNRINDSSELMIDKLGILPDYDKLEILKSEIFSVNTPWEDINKFQQKLIEEIKKSNDSIDFQNIGNTSRSIMDMLAREVFDSTLHKPNDPTKEVHKGKFKNQIHAYIDTVLSGSKNKQFRLLSETSIDLVEKSIDFMNTTTHKLNAGKHLAEVCVISTISAISIIKLINELE